MDAEARLEALQEKLLRLEASKLQVQELELQQARGLDYDSPLDLARMCDPTVQLWKYVQILSNQFVKAFKGESRRQMWLMPSRYGKTHWSARWGAVWALNQNPAYRIACISYGQELSKRNTRFCRDVIEQHADKLRVRVRSDVAQAEQFMTTQGGEYISAGVGGTVTGIGFDGIVFDDPYKNAIQAHSPTVRQNVESFWNSVVIPRLEEDASWIILPMTRWHPEDIVGWLLARQERGELDGWDVIRMPAIAEPVSTNPNDPSWLKIPDLLGREPGEVIEPKRYSPARVYELAKEMGSYTAGAAQQQRPAPEEGGEIKRHWWKLYTQAPDEFDVVCASWDLKRDDRSNVADYVVGQIWGRKGGNFYLLDQQRGKFDFLATRASIALMSYRWPEAKTIIIEDAGSWRTNQPLLVNGQPDIVIPDTLAQVIGANEIEMDAVEDILKSGISGIRAVPARQTKIERARQTIVPYAQSENIWLPEVSQHPATFAQILIDECASFPSKGVNDDTIDAASQALKFLSARKAARVIFNNDSISPTY